jgi:hypothetical protein
MLMTEVLKLWLLLVVEQGLSFVVLVQCIAYVPGTTCTSRNVRTTDAVARDWNSLKLKSMMKPSMSVHPSAVKVIPDADS